jgi:hypothetical protein
MYFSLHFPLFLKKNGMHAELLSAMNDVLSGKICSGPVIWNNVLEGYLKGRQKIQIEEKGLF